MSPEKKKQRRRDLLIVLVMFMAVVFTCRLWPILLLMILGVFTYAIWALVRNEREPVVLTPPPMLALPAPITEQELIDTAFGLLQRRITEALIADFPNAKWVWSQPGAHARFAAGEDLTILLADADGRRCACVKTRDLKFCQLLYLPYHPQQPEYPGSEEETEAVENDSCDPNDESASETIDYGLLAFEWVEANLPRLNALVNEAVAKAQTSLQIPADELPHGDSWGTICDELTRNGFRTAEALADGIRVQIKS